MRPDPRSSAELLVLHIEHSQRAAAMLPARQLYVYMRRIAPEPLVGRWGYWYWK